MRRSGVRTTFPLTHPPNARGQHGVLSGLSPLGTKLTSLHSACPELGRAHPPSRTPNHPRSREHHWTAYRQPSRLFHGSPQENNPAQARRWAQKDADWMDPRYHQLCRVTFPRMDSESDPLGWLVLVCETSKPDFVLTPPTPPCSEWSPPKQTRCVVAAWNISSPMENCISRMNLRQRLMQPQSGG